MSDWITVPRNCKATRGVSYRDALVTSNKTQQQADDTLKSYVSNPSSNIFSVLDDTSSKLIKVEPQSLDRRLLNSSSSNTDTSDSTIKVNSKAYASLHTRFIKSIKSIDTIPLNKWYYWRDMMNNYDFYRYSTNTNRAYYKLWELLNKYKIIDISKIVESKDSNGSPVKFFHTCHLAEAPGSFVLATQDFLYKNMYDNSNNNVKSNLGIDINLCSVAISREPSRKLYSNEGYPPFHRTLLQDDNIETLYGDVSDEKFIKNFIDTRISNSQTKKFAFVTADGGLDDGRNYTKKESLHHDLFFCETKAILALQDVGGSCVIKFYETFSKETLQILYLLIKHYTDYNIIKPKTSRPTNSERYVICRGFKSIVSYDSLTKTIHELKPVPVTTLERLQKVNTALVVNQIACIETIINIVSGKKKVDLDTRIKCKKTSFQEFCKTYNLRLLKDS